MKRFNTNGKSVWGSSRPDIFPRRQQPVGCRDFGNYNRRPFDDGEMENRPGEGSHHDDPVSLKLDRLLDRLDKLDAWRDKTDWRFENLEPAWSRYTEPPLGYEYGEDFDDEYFRQQKPWEMGYRQSRNQSNGYDQSVDRPPSCWDPHQRFQIAGYVKPERVKMHPPRFEGTNASNWISRVQSYFNHLMMPDAQRLHYAVMLFDQPAADWVFNYFANNDFVTWQDFLEDVRDRFDRQGPKPVMKERLQLHGPLSLAAARARALELADTHVDRTLQPPSSTTSRRPWQNREGRGQVGSTPAQQSSQHLPTPIQTQGGPGRAVDQARPPRVRVSQAEKAERARLGLCYYCPDKWVVGHVCKQCLLCYAEEGDEGVATYDENVPNDAAHNGGSNLDVPNDEAIEEIEKTDNMPLQGLVGVYDEKIGEEEDTASMKKGKPMYLKDVVSKKLIEAGPELSDGEDGSGNDGENNKLKSYSQEQEELRKQIVKSLVEGKSDDDKELPHGGWMKGLLATKTFNIGLNMPAKPVVFTNVQEFDGDYYVRRRLPIWRVFDPGGDTSPKLLLPTIVVAS